MSLLRGQTSKLCIMKQETKNKQKHGRQAEMQQRYFQKTKKNKLTIELNSMNTELHQQSLQPAIKSKKI